MEYARQYNNPDDLHHQAWNARQVAQQHYLSQLSGGSWSQPPWSGWKPIYGAGSGGSSFLQRYAQDGDSGFFHRGSSLFGRGEPLGANALPMNHFPDDYVEPEQHAEPTESTIEPIVTEPAPMPQEENLALQTTDAEPEQHALHVPPFSHLMKVQGMGKGGALYEEPFEMPEKYSGSLHRKKKMFQK
jgi:hypothetical protein